MRRKNLIVKRKAEKQRTLNSNLKTKKIYKKFKEVLARNIGKEAFVIGVSGGPDSLCLAYFSKLYNLEFKNKIHILIVNHNLRKESYVEVR